MKHLLGVIFSGFIFFTQAQDITIYKPYQTGQPLAFSEEFIRRFNSPESLSSCKMVYENLRKEGRNYDQLTPEEREILMYCDEVRENVWDIAGAACSWYCGGGPRSVTASSYLTPVNDQSYEPQHAHELNYQRAWVEGAEGSGVGEYLLYNFDPISPRITEIIVVNGYVKSQAAWEANGRVKKLKVYFNDKPVGILLLDDVRASQHFRIGTIGYGPLSVKASPWSLKFEILEVYEGTRYDDTVISEIYFDGIDVH